MKLWLALVLAAVAFGQYVSWLPPHAALIQAYPYNVTHFTAYENERSVYIIQQGLLFSGSEAERQAAMQYLYAQCRYVAVDVLNISAAEDAELWLADIYCSPDGRRWLWLRWLPLRFAAYSGYVEFANAVNVTVTTPVGDFKDHVPAGWYLDPATKTVFKVPEANVTFFEEIRRLNAAVQLLKSELQKSEANLTQASALIAQLKAQVESLEAQRRALEEAARQKESVITALNTNLQAARAENEALKKQLEELRRENNVLKSRLAELNKTYAAELSRLEAELQASELQAVKEEGIDPLPILLAALGGVVAAFIIYRRRRAEE